MSSLLIFVPKFKVFKSLTKISVYDILTNNFNVDVSQKIKPEYRVPINQYFEEINIFYEISNSNKKIYVHRHNNWGDRFILIILLFDLIRCVIYIFWNEDDQMIRLYGGNLEQFFGLNIKFFLIPEAGATLYAIAIYYLFQYSKINLLNWLKIFNTIEGKENFINSKIIMEKSAKKLIRFSLILIIYFSSITLFTTFLVCFFYITFPLLSLNLKHFFIYALPWALMLFGLCLTAIIFLAV